MGRKKSKSNRPVRSKFTSVDSDDDLLMEEEPDPTSRSFIYDEIDEFHDNREQSLLKAGKSYKVQRPSGKEAVYDLGLSDEDDDDEDEKYQDEDNIDDETVKRFTTIQRKDEMESDLEEEEEDVDVKDTNWGKRKADYYSTDFVDKDYQTLNENDAELAEAEEREAVALQQKLAEQMDDEDFGLEIFESSEAVVTESKVETKIEKDLSLLTADERLEILNRESPELMNLLRDFKVKLLEVRNRYQPLTDMVKLNAIPKGPGADYIMCKYNLLLNYCSNVCYYLMLKSKQQSFKNHGIIDTLVIFRKLLKELEPLDLQFEDEMGVLLERNKASNKIQILSPKSKLDKKKMGIPKTKLKKKPIISGDISLTEKKLSTFDTRSLMKTSNDEASKINVPQRKRKAEMTTETDDEKMALEMYEMMKKGHKKNLTQEENSDSEEEVESENGNIDAVLDEDSGKRGITYQIAKNKGLTPYRAKERRNPRVKYRMKYRKAKIRRKGQVREARKEISKYDGEFSGIKATSVRSIKLK